ncbi:hypothetical protein [Pontibacter sp. BAB1700]|uniref:hypothetical protein n=1 Tax=Pontibacter sp. BAB1700 TaxID=1144253 RepID=UPI00026BC965|nr:hypothetical protein [Pontibacter sp. BAB1700]EJF10630.1 hypothetical protein O71_07931 [Pontibacter sp. BAB1700]
MKKILERYHEKFSIEINLPKSKVMETIAREKEKKRDLASILGIGFVDYNEVKITGVDSVEIDVKPKMFNPYRGAGKIRIAFSEGKIASNTIAHGEIIPYTVGYQLFVFVALTFLLFMSLFTLVTASSTYGIGILVFGWLVLLTTLYLLPFGYRKKLRKYSDSFFADLKANKKKSIR